MKYIIPSGAIHDSCFIYSLISDHFQDTELRFFNSLLSVCVCAVLKLSQLFKYLPCAKNKSVFQRMLCLLGTSHAVKPYVDSRGHNHYRLVFT